MRGTRHTARSLVLMGIAALAVGGFPWLASAQQAPHVAVVRVDPGTYEPENYEARAAASRQFYASHADAYDFLVIFPAFEMDRSSVISSAETEGRHFLVRNAAAGIGLPVGEAPFEFGSSRRLLGVIDDYALVPGDTQDVEDALAVVAHEIAHQWSGNALFLDRRTGQVSTALLGVEASHWSYYLDSDASVLYGADWEPSAGGAYTAAAVGKRYSALDLYLMGFLDESELNPITLLLPASPAIPAASLPPAPGTRIAASPLVIAAGDLVAAMGPRAPSSTAAQASFRAAFLIAAPPGVDPTPEQLEFVNSVRVEFANRFFFMTRGRAVMQTELVEPVPSPVATSPSIQLGVEYLLANQRSDGSWADDVGTQVRDTQAALEALALFRSRTDAAAALGRGAAHLEALQLFDVDSSARRAIALSAVSGGVPPDGAPFCLANANPDGGWGLAPGYGSTVIDTALAALAGGGDASAAMEFLQGVQNLDGGWGMLPGGPSDLRTTALILHLLVMVDAGLVQPGAVSRAVGFLGLHASPDRRYLETDDRQDRTADVMLALGEWNVLTASAASELVEVLLSEQRADGSWEGSVERTAVALRALRALTAPNLSIRPSEIALSSTNVSEGEPVSATVLVRNIGHSDAGNVTVQAFDELGAPFGPATVIPVVYGGFSAVARLTIETAGHAGATQAFIVVDAGGIVDETTKEDNRVAVGLRVTPRPTLPDLFVVASSLSASPRTVTRLGSTITVEARIGNSGLSDVSAATVTLRLGDTVIGTRSVALPAGSSETVSLTGSLPTAALSNLLAVVIDPENVILEARENNNAATLTVEVQPTVDLAVALEALTPNPVDPGRDLSIRFRVTNHGTTAARSAASVIEILDGAGGVRESVTGPVLTIESGATATGSSTWRVSSSDVAAVRVSVQQAGDLDPADNVASGTFLVRESGVPNLTFLGAPVIDPSQPREARPALVTVTVENASRTAADASVVELWIGDPAAGGQRGSRVAVPPLAASATATVSLPLSTAPGDPVPLVVRVDPDDVVAEFDETDNDAVLYVEPLRLPDLALLEGSIRPSSLFPRGGDEVSVTVITENLGGQQSAPVLLELYAGAPERGGILIGSATVPPIDALRRAESPFAWDTSGWSGSVELVAVVNRDGSAEERRSDNDRSSRSVRVQSGNLAVSNPYFSPNGDGIKDATEVFYRIETPSAVDGVVRDERGRIVRVIHGTSSGDGTGALRWDGRTDAGTLAYDGNYRVLVQAQGQLDPLGDVVVVLDTDRSSFLDAPRELRATAVLDEYFRAQLPANEPNLTLRMIGTPDENTAIFHYSHTKGNQAEECAYYRVPLDGNVPELLTPPGFECRHVFDTVLALDGTAIYRLERAVTYDVSVTRFDIAAQTVQPVAAGLTWSGSPWRGPDGKTWIIPQEGGVVAVDLESGLVTTGPAPERQFPKWAPGGGMQAFDTSERHGIELHVANPDGTGERAVVVVYPQPDCLEYHGELCVRYEPLPIATPPGAYVLPEGVWIDAFTWVSPTELAFAGAGGPQLLDVATGLVDTPLRPDALSLSIGDLLADPAGRHLAIQGWAIDGGPQVWALRLADGGLDYAFDWTYGSWDVDLSFTRFGSSLIGQGSSSVSSGSGSWWAPHAVAYRTLGNLGLSITGLRKAGATEVVFRGTAADLNLERWEITARERRGTGAPIPVASGTNLVVEGELARWTPPRPGTWVVTLTGTDLAGNTAEVSTVSSWAEVPSITNLRAEPKYFSPNGDGRQDQLVVTYSVNEPVTSAFEIADAGGRLVRRIPVTQLATGTHALSWDGREENGELAADGTYSIRAMGSVADAILDTSPPEVSLTMDGVGPQFLGYDIRHPIPGAVCPISSPVEPNQVAGRSSVIPVLSVIVTHSTKDDHLLHWELQASDAESFDDAMPVNAGEVSIDRPRTDGLLAAQVPGRYMRLVAEDAAGNQATTEVVTIPESLALKAYGPASFGVPECQGVAVPMLRPTAVLPGAAPFVPSTVPGLAVQGVGAMPRMDVMFHAIDEVGNRHPFCYSNGEHAFAIESTIRSPLIGAAVAYEAGNGARVVDQSHVTLMRHGAVIWDARTAPRAIENLEVRVIDQQGRVFASPVQVGCEGPGGGGSGGGPDCEKAVGRETVHLALSRTQGVGALDTAVFRIRDVETGALLPIDLVLDEQELSDDGMITRSYHADVSADGLPGCEYEVVDVPGDMRPPAPLSHFDVCGLAQVHVETLGDTATLSLWSRYKKPVSRIDLYLEEFGRGQRTLVGSLSGANGMLPPVAIDLTPFSIDVPLILSARAVYADDTGREEPEVSAYGSCGPAQPIVRSGTKVQVKVLEHPAPMCSARAADRILTAEAIGNSDAIVDLGIEVTSSSQGTIALSTDPFEPANSVFTSSIFADAGVAPDRWAARARATHASGRVAESALVRFSTVATPPRALSVTTPAPGQRVCPASELGPASHPRRFLRVNGVVAGEQMSPPRILLRCGAEALNPVEYTSHSGALADIDVTSRSSGECELKLEVADASGASYCTAPVPFRLIGNAALDFAAAPPLFSPNGDGRHDMATFTLSAAEPSSVTVRGTDSALLVGTALITEVEAGTQQQLAWDGTLNGLPAADGDVLLRAEAVDECGNVAEAEAVVRVDTTPPRIQIESPVEGERISGLVSVVGEVSDANFLEYDVAMASGSFPSPAAFIPVGTFDRGTKDTIAEIPTAGLTPGTYTVRVQARDRAGNRSSTTVEFELTSNQIIRSLAVLPALVSPNGDAFLDSSMASYETLEDAIVSLDLISDSGAVLPVLLPQALPAGAGDVDLLETLLAALPDGVITVRLTATAGSLIETQDALLSIDRAPPLLSLEEPADGAVVAHATAVRGRVDDDHLDEWTLTMVQGGVSTTLATAHAPDAGMLATFADLPEGEYTLILDARDAAGNRWTEHTTFSVDRTPPVVALTSPAVDAWVSGQNGAVDVSGEVHDPHLANVRLDAVVDGRDARELWSGSALPSNGHLTSWDALSESDGPVLLWLQATDAAGNFSEAQVSVQVDNTPPMAAIDAPRDTFLRRGDRVTGAAWDENLSSWTLELTAGLPGSTSIWTPLADGDQSTDEVLTALGALPPDGLYGLRLTVTDLAGNTSGDTSGFTVDTTPPRPASALLAELQGDAAALSWAASPDADVVGYQVLRAAETGAFTPIGSLVAGTAAIDSSIADGHYRYVVIAVDAADLTSAHSSEARLDVDRTPPRVAISAPQPGAAVGGTVPVIGTAHSSTDFKEYRLSVGTGASPVSWQLVRRSPEAVVATELGSIAAAAFADETLLTIRLEGEDLSGNVAEARTTVTVDGAAPSAPALIAATAVGNAVHLEWQASPEPDVLGYVVFRNGTVASAPEGTGGARIAAHLLPAGTTTWVDQALPDGLYGYEVQAYDGALNGSDLSNSRTAEIETQAPRAVIVAPELLARLDGTAALVAEVKDQDVASVQFQVRAGATSAFEPLGEPLTHLPFTVALDPAAFSSPVLELRAVATDTRGNSDAAPSSTFVFHAPTPAAPGATATVTGANVQLSWSSSNPAGTIAGYEIERDGASRLSSAPAPAGTATASASASNARLAYDRYPSTAWTASSASRPSWRVDLNAPALVRALDVQLYATATVEIAVRVQDVWVPVRTGSMSGSVHASLGDGLQIGGVRVSFLGGQATVGLYEVTLDPVPLTPGPTWQDPDVAQGTYSYSIRAVSAFGLRAEARESARVYAPSLDPVPAVVSSPALRVTGADAASSSTVTVFRDGVAAGTGVATADGGFAVDVELADGANALTARAIDAAGNLSLPSESRVVTYDPVPVAALTLRLTGVHESTVDLGFEVEGDASRVAGFYVRRTGAGTATTLVELGPAARQVTDASVPNGTYTYTIVAHNEHGLEGLPSNPVEAIVAVAPPAVISGLTVSQVQGYPALRLLWEPSITGHRYLVERALSALGPFSAINADRLATSGTYVDKGLIPNVTYFYRVRAVDALGNAGAPSAVAWGVPLAGALARPSIVAPTTPGMPISIPSAMTAVSGLADPGVLVELRSNDVWLGEARAGGAELFEEHLGNVRQSRGFGVSPDGEILAVGTSWGGTEALAVYGPATNLWIEDPGLHSFGRVAFSPDRRWFAFEAVATDDGRLHVWLASTYDGSFQRVSTEPGDEGAPVWAPDGARLAYVVRRDSNAPSAIGVLEVGSSTEQVLAPPPGADLLSPAWTSSADLLAIALDSGSPASRIVRFDGVTWQHVYSAEQSLTELLVGPDSVHVALLSDEPGTPLWVIDLAAGHATMVDPTPAASRRAAFTTDGACLMQVRDGQLVRTILMTEDEEPLAFIGPVEALVQTRLGTVALTSMEDVVRYQWGGVFHFEAVPLFFGENLLVAMALDGAGQRSPPSEPISVTVEDSEVADLAVTHVAFQPSVPVTGDSVNAIVTVRNLGGVESAPSSLVVKHVPPGGIERELAPVRLGVLPPGATTAAIVPLGVVGVGPHEVVAISDPVVADFDRTNNLARAAFTVVASRALQLAVAAEPAFAPIHGQFSATVTVQNPGVPVDATLVTRLADAAGSIVFEAPPVSYRPLAGGSTTTLQVVLPAGAAIAGDYQVVAALSVTGAAPLQASTPVTIQPEVGATLAIWTDRFRHGPTSEVSLTSLVTNTSRNAPLSGATHHLEVLDAAGAVVWSSEPDEIPATWMGGTSASSNTVAAATLGAGAFLAHGWIELNGTVLAEASSPFMVVATPALVGAVAVAGQGDPPAVSAGTPAPVTLTFQNLGTAPSPAATGRLVVVAPGTGELLLAQELEVPALVAGGSASRALAVPTAGLRLDTYGLALVVEVQGAEATLGTARFRVADGAAPTLVLASPAQGVVVPGVVHPRIRAFDGETGVARVRAGLGGAAIPLALAAGNTLDGTWTAAIPLGPDGAYAIVFTGMDGEGNDGLTNPTASNPITLTVVSDQTPPVLSVEGVADGALVNTPVVLDVSATDLHLATAFASIDGASYQPGSAYTVEGTHVFRARAVDLAGNASTDARVFSLDMTPPDVSIAGVIDGQYLASPVVPLVVVTDLNPVTSSTLLDGGTWSGAPIATEGRHVLAVDARDAAGNTRRVETTFWIDLTPPMLAITGVESGACYARAVTPLMTATDAHLASSSSTLDGEPFTSGTTIGQEGAHVLAATAADRAGHEVTSQVTFSIDTTAPAITLPDVDGQFFAAPVTLPFSVVDAIATEVRATLDGAPFVSGGQVAAEGRHVLTVEARDCAGNQTTRAATFVIDTTPPTLALSGAIQGEIVAGPVAIMADAGDANLVSVSLELDGASYVAGTSITAAGEHLVTGVAVDAAGNSTRASVGFTIDDALPRIAVEGVADGDVLGRSVAPVVTVQDDNLAEWEATVDGVALPPGGVIGGEGYHELVVIAHDLAGNTASLVLHFMIDLTAPALEVGGVSDGVCYARDVTPTYSARDANLAALSGALDGAPFASGTTVGADGDHSLVVTARDRADHAVSSTTAFVVDKTAPTVTIDALDGRYFAGPVTPGFTVAESHLTATTVTLDGAPLAPGASVSSEGTHELLVSALDCAGNTSTGSAAFVIDATPPGLMLSGVAESAVVTGPVRVTATVDDLTPTTVTLTLDGAPYVSGTAIAAQGMHVVSAVATDAAGNVARASRSFAIDRNAPEIEVSGVSDGELTRRDVVPVVTVSDLHPAGWTATVDGVELPPGGAITAEGTHTLLVVALDQAGNEARAALSFEIDRTPPVISASVIDGGEYQPPVAVTFAATDPHLDPAVAGTLDGHPFESGGAVSGAGSHALVVTARDAAGNETTRTYRFSVTGQGPSLQVRKQLVLDDLRVLARVACGNVGDRSATFLTRALPAAHLTFVRNDVDLLVGLRSGRHDLIVITDEVEGAKHSCGDPCPPTPPVPPLGASELAKRLPAELTEAVHRGVGLVVFRTSTSAQPWLREALGLEFLGHENATQVNVVESAVSAPQRLTVTEGVALKLHSARGIGTFERDGKVAAAVHAFGLGAVVVLGFDPATATGGADPLVAGASAYAFAEAAPAAGGVVVVRIELENEGPTATLRVRERLDPALVVESIRSGGVLLPSGELEWTVNPGPGELSRLEYLLRLPKAAGTYLTTAEVAQLGAGQYLAAGTYPLSIAVEAGEPELLARAEGLAAAIPEVGCNKHHRKEILSDLALVRSSPGGTAQEREAAIAALLDAVDHVKALQGVDAMPLRLAIDSVLAVWEVRPW